MISEKRTKFGGTVGQGEENIRNEPGFFFDLNDGLSNIVWQLGQVGDGKAADWFIVQGDSPVKK